MVGHAFDNIDYTKTDGLCPAVQVMRSVLKAEIDANLVVMSGDMVSGMKWNGTEGWFAEM